MMRKKNKKVSLAKKPFLVLSRRAIAGWLVVIFLVCAWMFTIGVFVGRDTSPLKSGISNLQQKLDAALAELKQKKQAQTQGQSGSIKDNQDLEFYEVLKKNRPDAEIPKVPSEPAVEQKIEPSPQAAYTQSAPPAEKPPQNQKLSMKRQTKVQVKPRAQGESAKPEPPAKSESRPAATPGKTDPDAKLYTLQVAAFKAAGDADKLVAELKHHGFAAYRAIGKVPGSGIWYRVRIGEYNNKAEAAGMIAKLKNAGKSPVFVEK